MDGFLKQVLSLGPALKAQVAAIVTAVTGVVSIIEVAVADEAISLDEARGIWLAVTVALGTILGLYSVWKASNKPAATPPPQG